ncbi:MAG TPA: O-antigen ligase family protein [Halomicronema sp.]
MNKSLSLSSLKSPWNCAQIGLFFLPLSPLLGAVFVILALLISWRGNFKDIRRLPVNRGLAILAGWLFFICFFSDNPGNSFLGLFNFLPYFAIFSGFSLLLKTTEQLRRIAWILVIGSVPVILIGLGQLFLGWKGPIIFLGAVINWILAPGGNPLGRMSSVFEYANVLANYLVITFIFSVGLWLENSQAITWLFKPIFPFQVKPGYREYGKFTFLTLAVLLNGIGLVLTNSRNAWGLAVIACLVFAFYAGWRLLVAGFVGGAGVVFLSAFGPDPVRQQLRLIVPKYVWARLTDELFVRPTPTLRITQWNFAWNGTLSRPFTGWGFINFPAHYYQEFALMYKGQSLEWPQHPHNLFLMLSYETGLPATLFFCGLIGWILGQGLLLFRAEKYFDTAADRLIFFTCLIAFFATTAFHLFDVTLFDLRVNLLGWLLLAGIFGVVLEKRGVTA